MKQIILLIFLIGSLFTANAQRADRVGELADSNYRAKNYSVAAKQYIQSASLSEFKAGKKDVYYNAACCFALCQKSDSAFRYLQLALANGYKNKAHLVEDTDLISLHTTEEWGKLTKQLTDAPLGSANPKKARLITTDVTNFWTAYDLAQKDTANRLAIYRKYYIEPGSDGLQDYFAVKVKSLKSFVAGHDKRAHFYPAIRRNTLEVNRQKKQMTASFVKFKALYAGARFPDIYFIIGNFSSGGTSSDNGLLIGVDQAVRTPDIPTDELTLWQKNNFGELKTLPNLIAHELIHFQQSHLAGDTTLLKYVLEEGMADFLGELISGNTANQRLFTYSKGKEKIIWSAFKKEIYLNRYSNWIANSDQETADKPADLGYWIGYQICKAYYQNSPNKKQAIYDMLHIKNYRAFYEKSKVEAMLGVGNP